jgi:sugar porter (SP) family MFS transporter
MDKKQNTFLVALIVALGGFLMGFDASVISGVVEFIEPQFELTKIQLGWAVSCLTLTSTLAMIFSGPLSDKFGRKLILKYAALLYFFSAIFSAISPNFISLVFARMIGGLGVGASLILAPMYIAEIAPPDRRGRMVSFNQLNIVIGISVAFFTNYIILQLGKSDAIWAQKLMFSEYNWRWMLGLEALPAIIYFIFLFGVPESPRWLIMKGEQDKAMHIMSSLSTKTLAKEEYNNIIHSLEKDKNKEKTSFSDLFKPAMKLVLTIGLFIAILQQITGINAVFFYAPMIFKQTGIGTDASFVQAIIVGLTNLVFTVIAIALVDRFGRKPLLVFGLSGIVLSMTLLSFSFNKATYYLDNTSIQELTIKTELEPLQKIEGRTFDNDLDFKNAINNTLGKKIANENQAEIIAKAITINPWLVLFGIIGFVASFAVSLGPVMWILFSELFPNKLRGMAISLAGFVNSGISFSIQLLFPWELANIGNAGTFMIYGMFGLVGLIFIIMKLPETKGKSLEELESILVKE